MYSDAESEEYDTFDCSFLDEPSKRANNSLINSDNEIEFLFVVDISGSMRKTGVEGSNGRRIDVVVSACKEFLEKQSTTMPNSRYSMIYFNETAELPFTNATASEAQRWFTQKQRTLVPELGTNYRAALDELRFHCSKFHLRVLFMSDGRPQTWNSKTLDIFQCNWLPELIKQTRSLEIHCIGFGPNANEFEVLQQIAQLGCGTTQIANLDVAALRRSFRSISSSITATLTSTRSSSATPFTRTVLFAPPPTVGFTCKALQLRCERFDYAWNPATNAHVKNSVIITVSRQTRPYAQGSMRLVYDMREEGNTQRMVAKETKLPQTSKDEQTRFAESSACAAYFADIFREQTGHDVRILPCYVYYVLKKISKQSDDVKIAFCGEKHIPGVFTKWISNNGYISDSPRTDVLASFAHFTHHHSSGKLMVTDLQGVFSENRYTLTDPQVLSTDKRFGRADLGRDGMQKFLDAHKCGSVCQALGISRNTHKGTPLLLVPRPSLQKNKSAVSDRVEVHTLFRPAMLFVGECSLSFSCAAAQLYTESYPHARIKKWCLTELCWPKHGVTKHELKRNMLYLKSEYGDAVSVMLSEQIDATALPCSLNLVDSAFECCMWSMPYPEDFFPDRTAVSSALLKVETRRRVLGFVKAAAPFLTRSPDARVSVLLVAKQHLDWGLRGPVHTEKWGTLVPVVQTIDLRELQNCGYVPRFVDRRGTQQRTATFDLGSEAVVVSWRRLVVPMPLRGISNTKLG